jgi:hypothetical protein
LGVDVQGILTIGETSNMEKRRNDFVCGMDRCYGHSEANLLYYLMRHTVFGQTFAGTSVEFAFAPMPDEATRELVQEQLIKRYWCRHGELPPLQSNIPQRYGEWEEHALWLQGKESIW